MLKESDIIENLRTAFASSKDVVGIGDDAAVLPLNDAESYVVTKDILVEHKHFRLVTNPSASLGRKALHVNLSDIAAMGATPLFALLGIALPPSLEEDWVKKFLAGFTSACRETNVQLIGGDTTASERDVFISVTVIGRADKKHLKFRNGAKPGDVICAVGTLGYAHAGLIAMERGVEGCVGVKSKFLRPLALIAEGQWFGAQGAVTAMMDISDGLYIDLGKLLEASKAGAVVDVENLQPSTYLAEECTTLNLDPLECVLAGGEDYGLLATIHNSAFEKTAQDFKKQFDYSLRKIGVVTAEDGLVLRKGGEQITFDYRVFSHFGEM